MSFNFNCLQCKIKSTLSCSAYNHKITVKYIFEYNAMKYPLLYSIFFASFLSQNPSIADDGGIGNLTRKISAVYAVSKSCEDALYPGPKEYMELISEYLQKLYPNGVGYWVVPKYVQVISNTKTCINLMQSQLLNYKREMEEFQSNHPDREPPPVLVMYSWNDKYVPETSRRQERPQAARVISTSISMQKFNK